MSKHRTAVKRVGDLEHELEIELIQCTYPHGTVPTVRVRYAHNHILYAVVPLAHLPEDIQQLFT
jgi:hypothetical protein